MRMNITRALLLTAVITLLTAASVRAQYSYNKVLRLDNNSGNNGDFVEANPAPLLTDPMRVEAWINTTVSAGDQAIISRYRNNSGSNLDDSFQLSLHNGYARFQVNPGNKFIILDSTCAVADGTWHHIAGIYFTSTHSTGAPVANLRLVIDGGTAGFCTSSRSLIGDGGALNNPTGTRLRIGAAYNNANPGLFFHGRMDEVKIWRAVNFTSNSGPPFMAATNSIPIRDPSLIYDIVSSWRFNGFPDSGFAASFMGNATLVPAPEIPLAADSFLSLEGDGFVRIPEGNLFVPTNRLTVEARVRLSVPRGTLQSVVSKYRHNSGTDSDDSYFLGIEPGGVARFQISLGNSFRLVSGQTSLIDGAWHHIMGVYNGQSLKLFVDGQLEAINSSPVSGSIQVANNTPLLIGASGTSGVASEALWGHLDDVRIWNVERGLINPIGQTPIARWEFEGDYLNLVSFANGQLQFMGFPDGGHHMQFCTDDWCPTLWGPGDI
jgi:hypothetical protein